MSGHSKWANIKRRKAVVDAQKGKAFSRLAREITVAVREGGGPNPDANFRLKAALEKARYENLPADNVDRAIQRGLGAAGEDQVAEVAYEGYGPGGVAILVESITDNRNRTAGEVRHIFSRRGGSLGEAGCVAWLFEKKAVLHLTAAADAEDAVMERALEAGAEDVAAEEDGFTVTAPAELLDALSRAFEGTGPWQVASAGMEELPKTRVPVTGGEARRLLTLIDALEEQDDVQAVWANFDIPDEELERIYAEG